jgi:glycosyltransferase involved in cell wall biosynthesis
MVARTVPPVDRGGIQTHVLELATALEGRGVEVVAHLFKADYPDELPFEVVRIPYASLPRLTAAQYLSASLAAGLVVKRRAYDVVHGHSMYGWGAAVAGARPFVLTCHGTQLNEWRMTRRWTFDPNHLATDFQSYRMERWAARIATRLIAVSADNARDVREQYGVEAGRIEVVPNGVRPERFHAARPEGPTVLFVGRLHQRKGLEHLVRAMPGVLARVPDARLLVAGRGEREGRVRGLVRELGLERSVEMLGHVPDGALPDLYARASVFVMPSDYEGFGIVMLEAMASSVPVVAFRTGAAADLVRDGETGYLADPGTLADRIARVLEGGAKATAMGRRARELVEAEYTWERVAERTVQVYDRAIDQQQ